MDTNALDHEGLNKSQGDDFWITIKKDSVEIGADFMPEHSLRMSKVTITKRPHDICDLRALYTLVRSALIAYRKNYADECRKTADLQVGIAKFIATRRGRLAAKLEFFSERDPVKAAGFNGMLALLDELGMEFRKDVEQAGCTEPGDSASVPSRTSGAPGR
ncbi:hypothetical protein SDC9_175892 [bioreactor metagenome]|uniref:Uncharacterized protein n=1 Tax=bioreactor metagenome TaxID=1076179 RepID=A0A645GQE9_9ZZZZ